MLISTVTAKGQVTLPAKLRREMGFNPSSRVFFVRKNGELIIERLASVDSLFGSLANPKIKPLTNIQIRKSIVRGMFGKDDFT